MKHFWLLLFLPSLLWGLSVTSSVTSVSGTGIQTNAALSISGDGHAMSIWTENLPNEVVAAYFNGSSWLSPISVASGSFPQVGMDGSGNAIAVWLNTTNNQVFTSAFSATNLIWSTALQLSTGTSITSAPQIAVNSSGYALAVWVSTLPTNGLFASSFNVTKGTWSTPVTISTSTGSFPLVTLDESNEGIIFWSSSQLGLQAVTVSVP